MVALRETVIAAVGRVDVGMILRLGFGRILRGDVVALDPGAEVDRLERHVVLPLAGADAVAAADALLDVDDHRPPVLGHLVARSGRRLAGDQALQRQRLRTRPAGRTCLRSGGNRDGSLPSRSPTPLPGGGADGSSCRSLPRMLVGVDLGEGGRPRDVLLVAHPAEVLHVRQGRLRAARILGVRGERAVTRLAPDVLVLVSGAAFRDVRMAFLARRAPREGDRPRRVVGQRARAVVPVLTETLRDHDGADDEEQDDSHAEAGSRRVRSARHP